jgi:hypothetical protein
MCENKSNRWFYKLTDTEISNYKPKDKIYTKLIIRIPPQSKEIEIFKQTFKDCKFEFKTRENKDDPEHVKKYDFVEIDYDNTGIGDDYNLISFTIIKEEDVMEFYNILKDLFVSESLFWRHTTKLTYTIKIGTPTSVRGIWKSINHELPKYPVAILSFGRYNRYGRTHILLTKLKIPHYLFVEPCEETYYREWYDKTYCELIVSPFDFHKDNMGSTPMRNYILSYFHIFGKLRVWLLDDNIKHYKRLYKGIKNEIENPIIFTSIEKYVDRHNNVGIASHNFNPFIMENGIRRVMCKNGKCYSSMLILTSGISFKHKHQEDNFISIEYICAGLCNLCFNHILYNKNTSGIDEGGNTKFIYKKDNVGREERFEYSFDKSKELIDSGLIKLKENKFINDLVFHKPLKHEYHHVEFNYEMLENYDVNDIKCISKGIKCCDLNLETEI